MGASSSKIKARLEGAPVVVVVGAGYGGLAVAKALDKTFNVVLIDRKAYFLHNIGALRVEDGYEHKICIPYSNLLDYGHVVQAEVTRISPGGVYVYGRDEPIDFDYVVIATGTSYAFPCKIAEPEMEDATGQYTGVRERIAEAQRITVVGGGPTGVELCGEIKETHPDKDVTLIHSRGALVPGPLRDAFKSKLLEKVQSMGVEVMLNERVNLKESFSEPEAVSANFVPGTRQLTLESGATMETDLVFFCMGAHVNSKSYEADFGGVMNDDGRLRVNENLQVEGFTNVFALGDCNDVAEIKLGYAAQNQATVVAKNVAALRASKALKAYTPGHHVMIVTAGRNGGVAQLPVPGGKVMGSRFSAMVKSKGLFTANQWKLLRQSLKDAAGPSGGDEDVEPDAVPRLAQAMQISEEDAEELLRGLPVGDHSGESFT
ncbi:apoptosis-inducing factor 2 [Thecamonas trahens ATCC 50062]|uniref:Apoptosis-inducing factor 2 n=1 Tax=Thecamonas trahens ATCC 50062 TaxID=461836 RepID=A0A0L0D7D5_THETB|nr:apoptosis-inducing factor 2 [Thecamonas trahens ATCC 50062]KNC48095.1 apoptosis-inducing factor 2 [Thecamonas trahens ATCC 50062]|eukprot:XP_013759108.1 apoptosis-inducing factor 2 [Thecamonas trahens ATCC 50062]